MSEKNPVPCRLSAFLIGNVLAWQKISHEAAVDLMASAIRAETKPTPQNSPVTEHCIDTKMFMPYLIRIIV